jgi:hypothetical protein
LPRHSVSRIGLLVKGRGEVSSCTNTLCLNLDEDMHLREPLACSRWNAQRSRDRAYNGDYVGLEELPSATLAPGGPNADRAREDETCEMLSRYRWAILRTETDVRGTMAGRQAAKAKAGVEGLKEMPQASFWLACLLPAECRPIVPSNWPGCRSAGAATVHIRSTGTTTR